MNGRRNCIKLLADWVRPWESIKLPPSLVETSERYQSYFWRTDSMVTEVLGLEILEHVKELFSGRACVFRLLSGRGPSKSC